MGQDGARKGAKNILMPRAQRARGRKPHYGDGKGEKDSLLFETVEAGGFPVGRLTPDRGGMISRFSEGTRPGDLRSGGEVEAFFGYRDIFTPGCAPAPVFPGFLFFVLFLSSGKGLHRPPDFIAISPAPGGVTIKTKGEAGRGGAKRRRSGRTTAARMAERSGAILRGDLVARCPYPPRWRIARRRRIHGARFRSGTGEPGRRGWRSDQGRF